MIPTIDTCNLPHPPIFRSLSLLLPRVSCTYLVCIYYFFPNDLCQNRPRCRYREKFSKVFSTKTKPPAEFRTLPHARKRVTCYFTLCEWRRALTFQKKNNNNKNDNRSMIDLFTFNDISHPNMDTRTNTHYFYHSPSIWFRSFVCCFYRLSDPSPKITVNARKIHELPRREQVVTRTLFRRRLRPPPRGLIPW